MILVTGAAGKTGQAIVQALINRKAPVRAFVYRTGHHAKMEALAPKDTAVIVVLKKEIQDSLPEAEADVILSPMIAVVP
ncbi:MAG: NmrA family NAD(P)-binding protein, partial [Chloroflexota bacterium]